MRIAVIGPQNTGKSTLINDLLQALPGYTTPKQTYRDVIREQSLSINRESSKESQQLIRDFLYEQLRQNKEENILFDRCLIDNLVYSQAVAGSGAVDNIFLDETAAMMKESLDYLDGLIYIPTTVAVRLKNDSVRDTNRHYIDRINVLFIENLMAVTKVHPLPILVTSGTREERVQKVERWLTTMASAFASHSDSS